MEESIVQFFSEETDFQLAGQESVRSWVTQASSAEEAEISFLNYVFCTDEYLLEMNRQYLDHDDYTDVITFPYSENTEIVEGDIFISIDRVSDNAAQLGIPFLQELHRVMIHGLLHLLGYNDKSPEEKIQMTAKEDYYLSLLV